MNWLFETSFPEALRPRLAQHWLVFQRILLEQASLVPFPPTVPEDLAPYLAINLAMGLSVEDGAALLDRHHAYLQDRLVEACIWNLLNNHRGNEVVARFLAHATQARGEIPALVAQLAQDITVALPLPLAHALYQKDPETMTPLLLQRAFLASPPLRSQLRSLLLPNPTFDEIPVAATRYLPELLTRWRQTRHLELRNAILQLTLACPEPPELGTQEQQAWWNHQISRAQPVEVGMALLAPWIPIPAFLSHRMDTLRALDPDPRTTLAIVRILHEMRDQDDKASRSIQQKACQLLDRVQDPSLTRVTWERIGAAVHAQLPFAPPPKPLTSADADLIVRAMSPEPQQGRLLQAIYQAPDSREARLVYADFLSEHQDPRGEFIQLQCDEKQEHRQRIRALLSRHLRVWSLSPPGNSLRGVRFSEGFPVEATFEKLFPRQLLHPACVLLTTLRLPILPAAEVAELLSLPTLARVRHLPALGIQVYGPLDPIFLRLETLAVVMDYEVPGPPPAIPHLVLTFLPETDVSGAYVKGFQGQSITALLFYQRGRVLGLIRRLRQFAPDVPVIRIVSDVQNPPFEYRLELLCFRVRVQNEALLDHVTEELEDLVLGNEMPLLVEVGGAITVPLAQRRRVIEQSLPRVQNIRVIQG